MKKGEGTSRFNFLEQIVFLGYTSVKADEILKLEFLSQEQINMMGVNNLIIGHDLELRESYLIFISGKTKFKGRLDWCREELHVKVIAYERISYLNYKNTLKRLEEFEVRTKKWYENLLPQKTYKVLTKTRKR